MDISTTTLPFLWKSTPVPVCCFYESQDMPCKQRSSSLSLFGVSNLCAVLAQPMYAFGPYRWYTQGSPRHPPWLTLVISALLFRMILYRVWEKLESDYSTCLPISTPSSDDRCSYDSTCMLTLTCKSSENVITCEPKMVPISNTNQLLVAKLRKSRRTWILCLADRRGWGSFSSVNTSPPQGFQNAEQLKHGITSLLIIIIIIIMQDHLYNYYSVSS